MQNARSYRAGSGRRSVEAVCASQLCRGAPERYANAPERYAGGSAARRTFATVRRTRYPGRLAGAPCIVPGLLFRCRCYSRAGDQLPGERRALPLHVATVRRADADADASDLTYRVRAVYGRVPRLRYAGGRQYAARHCSGCMFYV